MKTLYWLLKLGVRFVSYLLIFTYWGNSSWLFFVFIALILIVSEIVFTKKIDYYTKIETLEKYPWLNNIDNGERISIVLKNGEKIPNVIYFFFDEKRIYVFDPSILYGKRQKRKKTKDSIKLKKIESNVFILN